MNSGSSSGQPVFDTQDLLRYLEGKMSKQEMHELEKAALDDPFLQDALEGMQQLEEKQKGQWSASLQLLKKQWAATQQKRGTTTLLRWSVAATILLAVLAAGIKYAGKKNHQQPLAVAENLHKELPAPNPDSTIHNPGTANDVLPKDNTHDTTIPNARIQSQKAAKASAPPAVKPIYKKTSPPAVNPPMPAAVHDRASMERIKQRSSPDLQAKNKIDDTALAEIVVSAVYEKASDTAISRATENKFGILKGQKKAGAYGEPLPESSASNLQQLSVAKASILKRDSPSLSPKPKLKEAVPGADSLPLQTGKIVAARAARTQSAYQPATDTAEITSQQDNAAATLSPIETSALLNPGAMPAVGWKAFETYIKNNRKSVPGEKPGRVILRFFLDRQNQLSDIQVEAPLTEGQDEEAVRLLTEGPAWKLTQKRATYVRLIIRF